MTLDLTEPQAFWLSILLESTLSAADRSRATASYEATLKKLRAFTHEYCGDCDGCGWYEGGKTLKTTCGTCGGTGLVRRKV